MPVSHKLERKQMEIKLISDLKKHIIERNYISIKLFNDPYIMSAIPISASNALLLLMEIRGLLCDGYSIIRTRDIEYLERTSIEEFSEKILEAENMKMDVNSSTNIQLKSWETALITFIGSGEIILVDTGIIDSMKLGIVTGLTEKAVTLRLCNSDGTWDDQQWLFSFSEINGIKFRNHYTKMYTKHVGEPPPLSQEPVHIWTLDHWKNFYDISDDKNRSGIRMSFDKDVENEVKVTCKEFVAWLRTEYLFPIRLKIYVKSSEKIKAIDGEEVVGTCFLPYDRNMEPYIKISAGDYRSAKNEEDKVNILVGIIESIIHEITHYFQWINDLTLTDDELEEQASEYTEYILDQYFNQEMT